MYTTPRQWDRIPKSELSNVLEAIKVLILGFVIVAGLVLMLAVVGSFDYAIGL